MFDAQENDGSASGQLDLFRDTAMGEMVLQLAILEHLATSAAAKGHARQAILGLRSLRDELEAIFPQGGGSRQPLPEATSPKMGPSEAPCARSTNQMWRYNATPCMMMKTLRPSTPRNVAED